MKKTEKFSIYGISIAGGVMHNVGQLLVAAYVMQTAKIIYYMPVLLVAGTLAGAAIGILGAMIYRRIDKHKNRIIEICLAHTTRDETEK